MEQYDIPHCEGCGNCHYCNPCKGCDDGACGQCGLNSKRGAGLCQHGYKCNKISCKKAHPPGFKTVCYHGAECKNETDIHLFRFYHPKQPGRRFGNNRTTVRCKFRHKPRCRNSMNGGTCMVHTPSHRQNFYHPARGGRSGPSHSANLGLHKHRKVTCE